VILTASPAIVGDRLSDHHDRLRFRGKADLDVALFVLDLKMVSDVEAEGFEPFALHLDLRVTGVSAASVVSAVSAAAGILDFDVLCFGHSGVPPLHGGEKFCGFDLGISAAVSCETALLCILGKLVFIMAFDFPYAGLQGLSMTVLMHESAFVMCVIDFA